MPERLRLMVTLASWCALRFGETVELRGAGDQQQPPEPSSGHGFVEEMTHWRSGCRGGLATGLAHWYSHAFD